MPASIFLAAPHRVMFTAGIVQLLLAFAAWSVELLMRLRGAGTLLPAMSSALWHPLMMVFAFFPFLIMGFLMTALPKWVGAPALAAPRYLPAFLAMATGWLLLYGGAIAALPLLAAAGLASAAVGWAHGGDSLRRAAAVDNPDKRHAWAAIACVFIGAALLLAAAVALALDRPASLRAIAILGLWLSIAPIFTIVTHRMLPFFSQGVIPHFVPYRPLSFLWGLLACLGLHGVLDAFALAPSWPTDVIAAGLALTLSWRWRFVDSFRDRLLATHHVAFAWLGIACAAFAVQGMLGHGGSAAATAPLHALTTGFLLLMVLGMTTRVTLGHSGLPIVAPRWVWSAFWILQAAVLLRLAADFAPATLAAGLLATSALLMLLVFAVWCVRHVAHFFRPRADGLPG